MTPLKEVLNVQRPDTNSADKAKGAEKMLSQAVLSSQKGSSNESKDFGKVSHSAENPKKFISKTRKEKSIEKKAVERSPLIQQKKVEEALLTPESSHYERDLIREHDHLQRSSRMSNRAFSPRKALDFADKSQQYKGRNLFEDNYQ